MPYLLDTNVVAVCLNGHAQALARLDALEPADVRICAPVLAELTFGAHLSTRTGENLSRIEHLAAWVSGL